MDIQPRVTDKFPPLKQSLYQDAIASVGVTSFVSPEGTITFVIAFTIACMMNQSGHRSMMCVE